MKAYSRLAARVLFTVYIFNLGLMTSRVAAQDSHAWQPSPGHETLLLWPNGAPRNPPSPGPEQTSGGPNDQPMGGRAVTRLTNVSSPTVTVYQPPVGKRTGAAVLVMPGGSYRVLAIDKEGTEVCEWLNSIGVTAILLKYRVPDSGPYPKSNAAFEDGQRAMRIIRAHADEWKIDPRRIGALGFSAGAHLAAVLSNLSDKRIYPSIDTVDQLSSRPDFALIIYPGWLTAPNDRLAPNPAIPIDPNGPPSFLVQAEDDEAAHVESSLIYFLALKNAKVHAELHVYSEGGHGFGLRPTEKPVSNWPQLAATWFKTIGVLK